MSKSLAFKVPFGNIKRLIGIKSHELEKGGLLAAGSPASFRRPDSEGRPVLRKEQTAALAVHWV